MVALMSANKSVYRVSKCAFFILLDGELNFETSHDLFRNAFQKGFPWEVLRVFSGPPEVLLSWRHWGEFVGEYRGNEGRGETIEMYGLLRITLNEEMKIKLLEVFYDPDTFIEVMEGRRSPKELKDGVSILGNIKKTAIEKRVTCCKHRRIHAK